MSKRILVLLYIAAILLISGFVKAMPITKYTRALVSTAQVTQTTGILDIGGVLSTTCETNPAIYVNSIDQNQKLIKMSVLAELTSDVCNEGLGPQYFLSFDLKSLPLQIGQTYKVVLDNSGAEKMVLVYSAQAEDPTLKPFKADQATYKGLLLHLVALSSINPSGFVLQRDSELVPVISPEMSLTRFTDGTMVWIFGYVLRIASLNTPMVSAEPFPADPQPSVAIVPVSISAIQ